MANDDIKPTECPACGMLYAHDPGHMRHCPGYAWAMNVRRIVREELEGVLKAYGIVKPENLR